MKDAPHPSFLKIPAFLIQNYIKGLNQLWNKPFRGGNYIKIYRVRGWIKNGLTDPNIASVVIVATFGETICDHVRFFKSYYGCC
jgi:hypothetical protein